MLAVSGGSEVRDIALYNYIVCYNRTENRRRNCIEVFILSVQEFTVAFFSTTRLMSALLLQQRLYSLAKSWLHVSQ